MAEIFNKNMTKNIKKKMAEIINRNMAENKKEDSHHGKGKHGKCK
jgi:hypothetical protein